MIPRQNNCANTVGIKCLSNHTPHLNDLDKLPVLADNNSNEPNPTNIVVEDMDTDGTLVDISTVDKVSRDKSTLTFQRIFRGRALELQLIF